MKTKQHLFNRTNPRVTHLLKLCWLPLFALLLWGGCRHEGSAGGDVKPAATIPINPVGTYTLVSVDARDVPCLLQHNGHTMNIKSGSFNIHADGTCSSQIFLEGNDRPIEVKATYTQEGSKLTMKWLKAGTTIGTVEGETFTMNNEGMVFAYRK